MILADTCIWADYLGPGDVVMAEWIAARKIVMHPFVLGEIAFGNLRNRAAIIADLRDIRQLPIVEPDELLAFIDTHALAGTGVGYIDAHLLASTRLSPGTRLWTRDKRLHAAAEQMGIAAKPMN